MAYLQKYSNLEFMYGLIGRMIKPNPEHRPTMDDALGALDALISKLSWWKLRARLRDRRDDAVLAFLKDVVHTFRTTFYILLRLPAIPSLPERAQPVERRKRAGLGRLIPRFHRKAVASAPGPVA